MGLAGVVGAGGYVYFRTHDLHDVEVIPSEDEVEAALNSLKVAAPIATPAPALAVPAEPLAGQPEEAAEAEAEVGATGATEPVAAAAGAAEAAVADVADAAVADAPVADGAADHAAAGGGQEPEPPAPAPAPVPVVLEDTAAELTGSTLEGIERSRAAASAEREAALRALTAAVEANDAAQAAGALAAARKVFLGSCAESKLAESLTRGLLHEGEGSGDLAAYMQAPAEHLGLSEEAAVQAELEVWVGLSKEQQRARVLELTRSLAATRLHSKATLEAAIMRRVDEAEAQSLRDLQAGMEEYAQEHVARARAELVDFEAALMRMHEEAVKEAAAAADAEASAGINAERESLNAAYHEGLVSLRTTQLSTAHSDSLGMQKLAKVLDDDAAVLELVKKQQELAVAVVEFEAAMMSGKDVREEFDALKAAAAKSDPFAAELMEKVPPGCLNPYHGASVPTTACLQQSFLDEVEVLREAVFVPPDSGVAGELAGRFLKRFYAWGSGAASDGSASSDVTRSVKALSKIKTPGTCDELRTALLCLENSLDGPCKQRAAVWIDEMRATLLLHQALLAVKARANCMPH